MSAPLTQLSQNLAQVVGVTPDYHFYYLSELLKRPVLSGTEGKPFGRIKDLVARVATPYPPMIGLLVDHGWAKPHEFVPWERVTRITPQAVTVALTEEDPPYRPYAEQPGWILLNEHLMHQSILDIDGHRSKVVNDLHLLESKGRMLLVHVDTSHKVVLRRLGLGRAGWTRARLISWRSFRPLSVEDAATDTVMLTVTRRQTRYLPSDDLAAALAELKGGSRGGPAAPEGFDVSDDYVAVHRDMTAGEVLKALRDSPHQPDAAATVFVIKSDHTLVGAADLAVVALADEATPVESLMTAPAAAVPAGETRAKIADRFVQSGARVLPVVDAQNHLLGVVHRSGLVR
jgi:CBS domain-containing protein